MKTRLLVAALAGVTLYAAAATAYGYRTRSIAMNAGAENEKLKAAPSSSEAVRAEIDQSNQRLYETAIRADAGLPLQGPVDPATADAAVRDFIHRTNIVGSKRPIGKYPPRVYAGIGTEEGALLCGGMSISHAWAMNVLGIPARIVQLGGQDFLSGKYRNQTHVLSEVFLDGDWHISDPTFNISVNCSDGETNISVKEAFACLASGQQLVAVQGKTTVPGKSISDFRAAYADYFAAYELASSPLSEREMYPSDTWLSDALSKYEKHARN